MAQDIIQVRSLLGTKVFNGDGTGSDDFVAVITPIRNASVKSIHATATFTYEVESDGTVTIEEGPVTAIVVVPPARRGRSSRSDGRAETASCWPQPSAVFMPIGRP